MTSTFERPATAASLLDESDSLRSYRNEFLEPAGDKIVAYLDGNSLGRPLAITKGRMSEFIDTEWGGRLIRSWDERWMDEPTKLGDKLGDVVLGAAPGQTVIGDSTSVLLYKLLRAALDSAMPAGRDEIILDRDNFPTDRFIAEGIAAECGATIRWIQPDAATGVRRDDLAAVLGPRTAVVLLSHVAYRSGFLADARTITALVKAEGALMLWDLCHSVGSVPLHLDDWGVDLAVGCTYKYLNGGPGAPAFAYVRSELQDRLQQPIWGWMGANQPFGMSPSYEPAAGIRRFITGTPPVLAMQPLKHMLDLIAEAGMPAIREKSIALTAHAVTLADEWLTPLGAEMVSPRNPDERGSHITINHPLFAEATARLWERGVIPDFRPPNGLRIGLSPLSTSFAELEAGMSAIHEVLSEVL